MVKRGVDLLSHPLFRLIDLGSQRLGLLGEAIRTFADRLAPLVPVVLKWIGPRYQRWHGCWHNLSFHYFCHDGFVALRRADSSTGTRSGSPYTVHDDENTMSWTPAACMARSSEAVPATFTV